MLRRAVTVAAGSRRHAASGEGGWLLPAPPMRLATRLLLMLLTCAAILWLGMLDRQPRASSSNPVPVRLASALKPLRTHVHSPHVRNHARARARTRYAHAAAAAAAAAAVAEPAVAEPAVAEPAVAEPAVAEPAVAEPAAAFAAAPDGTPPPPQVWLPLQRLLPEVEAPPPSPPALTATDHTGLHDYGVDNVNKPAAPHKPPPGKRVLHAEDLAPHRQRIG